MNHNRSPQIGQKPKHFYKTAKRLLSYVWKYKALCVLLLAVSLVCISIDIGIPLLIEGCIDCIATPFRFTADNRFFYYLFALIGAIVAGAVMGWLHGVLSARLSLNTALHLRASLFLKTISIPYQKTQNYMSGDLMSRVLNDTTLAADAYSQSLLSLISNTIVIAACAVIMFSKDVSLSGITIGISVACVLLTAFLSKFIFSAVFQQQTDLGLFSMHLEESIRSFRTATLFGRMHKNRQLNAQYTQAFFKSTMKTAKWEMLMQPLMLFLGNLNFLCIVIIGAKNVMAGLIGLGTLQVFLLYSRQFSEPLNEYGLCFAQMQSSLAAAERIFELMDIVGESDICESDKSLYDESEREQGAQICFNDVSFSYCKSKQVLNHVSLTIQPAEHIALVGETGAGKTTLVSLLVQLYSGYSGSILIEHSELAQWEPSRIRKTISLVPQEPQLISGTVLDNITYGNPDATQEDVTHLMQELGIEHMIHSLPHAYQTEVCMESDILSQGQKQIICLARALLRNPHILILDEATSSVDAATEQVVRQAIEKAMEKRTCIMIAHRMSSVIQADRIFVMENGEIQAVGTHAQLLQNNQTYQDLFYHHF